VDFEQVIKEPKFKHSIRHTSKLNEINRYNEVGLFGSCD